MILTDEELRKAQLLMLKILKEVHRVCEENNIKYFLSDGTLIGAVRHNGFIPWDDDLDVGMVRSEYEKFCKIATEKLSKEFVLQNYSTDKGFALPFSKVILLNTTWLEKSAEQTNREYDGIFIDIFPYDKIPVDSKEQIKHQKKVRFINGLIYQKLHYNTFKNTKGFPRKCFFLIKGLISAFYSVDKLISKRESLITKFEDSKENFVCTKYGGNYWRNQNPYDSFFVTELHKFEDSNFYIPKNYDGVLTNLYGNYMQLPPVENRVNHGVFKFDFGAYK